MGKVFFDVGITLDGFIAGPEGSPSNPLGSGGIAIHEWLFEQKSFRKHLELDGAGSTGKDNDIVEALFGRIGANIMGKRMFDEGEVSWPENAPFGVPVYVLTKQKRDPWVRKGGTTFFFVNDNINTVLEKAKIDAGKKDVRISGGANTIIQFLNAGLIDEFGLHVAPMMLSKGVRLFENILQNKYKIEIIDVVNSKTVTHLWYKVNNMPA